MPTREADKLATVTVRILCRLWEEDGVWNAVAEHLPVAVFGATFEEARHNLKDAIDGHLRTVSEIGKIAQLLEELADHARDYEFLNVTELPPQSVFVPIQAVLRDGELLAVM